MLFLASAGLSVHTFDVIALLLPTSGRGGWPRGQKTSNNKTNPIVDVDVEHRITELHLN